MKSEKYLSISEFAKLSGINRKNLIYYNQINLLCPAIVKENGYRYYTYPQLDTVSVIVALKEIGVPLNSIKHYLNNKSPDNMISLFLKEEHNIDEKIKELKQIKSMLTKRILDAKSAKQINIKAMKLEYFDEEKVFIGPDFNYNNNDVYSGYQDFTLYCYNQNLIYGYPLGIRIKQQNIFNKQSNNVMNYFYTINSNTLNTLLTIKPSGTYLVAYSNSYLADGDDILDRMFKYINDNNLVISGDCFIENILDEIAVSNQDTCIAKVMILVKNKK